MRDPEDFTPPPVENVDSFDSAAIEQTLNDEMSKLAAEIGNVN